MRTKGAAHEETRRNILKAARGLVLKGGHESLSLREVARDVGFSPASLYEYFDGKDAIVRELAREVAGSLRAALERKRKGHSARGALVALGLAYVSWAKDHPEDFLLVFNRLPSKRQSLAEAAPESSPYRLVLDAARRAHEAGLLPGAGDEAVERLAYAVWAAAHGMAMLQLTHLATFKADFASADRAALEALVAGFAA